LGSGRARTRLSTLSAWSRRTRQPSRRLSTLSAQRRQTRQPLADSAEGSPPQRTDPLP
jgi:hypothetical protein